MTDMQAIEYIVNTYHPLFKSCPNRIIFIRDVYHKHKVAQGVLSRINTRNHLETLKCFRTDIPRFKYLTRRRHIIEQYRRKNNQVLKVLNSNSEIQDILLATLANKLRSLDDGK